jgi:AcrR family transcriptional regulator
MDGVKSERGARRPTLRDERAQVTRQRIADAARRLFARQGYAATTLAGIATEAGVAVQTVYAVYGSKVGILHVLRESAMNQPEAEALYALAMDEPSAPRRLDLFARSIRRRWELSGDVVAIHRDAGTADPEVRAGVAATLERRQAGIRALASTLEKALRPGMDVAKAAAIVDALTLPEVYAELVDVQRWAPDAYEGWLAAALCRELLDAAAPPASRRTSSRPGQG